MTNHGTFTPRRKTPSSFPPVQFSAFSDDHQHQITYGHNKDHRPDLKQLVFGLTATADGAVPVWHDVFSGNRTDDTVHRSTVDALRAIVGRAEFIYVADCKLLYVGRSPRLGVTRQGERRE